MRDRIKNAVSALRGVQVQNQTMELSQIQQWSDLSPYGSYYGPVSRDVAERHSAVYACARLIASGVGQIPLKTFKRLVGGERDTATGYPIASKLNLRPNFLHSKSVFWWIIVDAALKGGNGYGYLERNRSGQVLNIWPYTDAETDISRQKDGPRKGRLNYRFRDFDGTVFTVDQDDVLHIPGSTEWDGFKAKSPIRAYGDAAALGVEANKFSRELVDNASSRPMAISYPNGAKDPEQIKKMQEHFRDRTTGANRNLPAIITDGGEVKELGISAADAQLLETRQFQVEEIARIFGVPPHMIGHVSKTSSWGTGIEEQTRAFVQYTLGPHLKAIEEEINYKIFRDFRTGGEGPLFAEFKREALVQMNLNQRYEAHSHSLGGSGGPGWKSPNEVRRSENLPPVDGGDQLVNWNRSGQQEPTK